MYFSTYTFICCIKDRKYLVNKPDVQNLAVFGIFSIYFGLFQFKQKQKKIYILVCENVDVLVVFNSFSFFFFFLSSFLLLILMFSYPFILPFFSFLYFIQLFFSLFSTIFYHFFLFCSFYSAEPPLIPFLV